MRYRYRIRCSTCIEDYIDPCEDVVSEYAFASPEEAGEAGHGAAPETPYVVDVEAEPTVVLSGAALEAPAPQLYPIDPDMPRRLKP